MRASEDAAQSHIERLLATPDALAQEKEASLDGLYRLVTSYRWRKSSVDPSTARDIQSKLQDRVNAGRPISFSIPFGGYKAWHQPSYPHIDWAEVMWVDHLRSYGVSIAREYRPGVEFSLSYNSRVLDLVNNTPLADQETYIDELRRLLELRSCDAVSFQLVDLTMRHDSIEQLRADIKAAMQNTGEGAVSQAALRSAQRNLAPVGVRDLSALDEADTRREVQAAAQACAVLESQPNRRLFNKYSHRIQISHIRGPALALHLGSTRASTHQPWVGTGYLALDRKGRRVDTIAAKLPPCEFVPAPGGAFGPALELLPVESAPAPSPR